MVSWFNRRLRRDREDGAALVEFALVLPLLLTLLIGIVEFGWALGNNLDVRHGGREAARLVAVNADTSPAMVISACDSMDFSDSHTVSIALVTAGANKVGDLAEVTVTLDPYTSLTGFLDWAMPDKLESVVEIRLEQDATWAEVADQSC